MDAELERLKPIIHRRDADKQSLKAKSKARSVEGAEVTGSPGLSALTQRIIGTAIEVHRNWGPGLLESVYEECLCYELSHAGLSFRRRVPLPIPDKGLQLDCGYRLDPEDSVIIENKTVDQLLPIHCAPLLTDPRLSGLGAALLLNFNEPIVKKGIKRLVNHSREPSAKPVISAPEPREEAALPNPTSSLRDSASPRLCGEKKS